MSLTLSLIAVPILIVLNAFFVAAEYAIVAARPSVIDALPVKRRDATVTSLRTLMSDPASAIGAIQICITMTNLLIGWIAEPAMSAILHRLFGPAIALAPDVMFAVSTCVSFIIVTLLTVVFSELLPKALTLKYVSSAATLTAVPILLIRKIARPLVWLMNGMANVVTVPLGLGRVDESERQQMTVQELRMQISQATQDGVISRGEQSLILNGLTVGKRTAREILTPRVHVAHLDLNRSTDENGKVAEAHLYTHLPL
jgi:CBS domain containing-hemolysin-like protein